MNLAMKNNNEISEFDRIIEAIENSTDPRIDLLKEGHNAIYYDEAISDKYNILNKPDGKCYFLDFDEKIQKSVVIRELNNEEYSKIDLKKGIDY